MNVLAAATAALALQTGAPADAIQTDLAAPGPAGVLRGTLVMPAVPEAPAILVIPGSGPTDRDGNAPGGIRSATYRLLAEGLSQRGIATARIDKRGMYGSRSAIPDADDVTIEEYADDVRTWVATIRQRTGLSCVWLLGHSEGGLVALAAARNRDDICGIILAAAPGRPLGEVLHRQLSANPANTPVLDNALAVLSSLERGQRVEASQIDPALLPLFRPAVQRFLISELALDPAALLSDYAGPALILQGTRDIQVEEADAKRLKDASPRAELTLLADVSHVLKTVRSDNRAENIKTYTDPALPLADGVIAAIADFLQRHAPPERPPQ